MSIRIPSAYEVKLREEMEILRTERDEWKSSTLEERGLFRMARINLEKERDDYRDALEKVKNNIGFGGRDNMIAALDTTREVLAKYPWEKK